MAAACFALAETAALADVVRYEVVDLGSLIDGPIAGTAYSRPFALNNNLMVVGESASPNEGGKSHAVVWTFCPRHGLAGFDGGTWRLAPYDLTADSANCGLTGLCPIGFAADMAVLLGAWGNSCSYPGCASAMAGSMPESSSAAAGVGLSNLSVELAVQALGFADMASIQSWLAGASSEERDAAMTMLIAILEGGDL